MSTVEVVVLESVELTGAVVNCVVLSGIVVVLLLVVLTLLPEAVMFCTAVLSGTVTLVCSVALLLEIVVLFTVGLFAEAVVVNMVVPSDLVVFCNGRLFSPVDVLCCVVTDCVVCTGITVVFSSVEFDSSVLFS